MKARKKQNGVTIIELAMTVAMVAALAGLVASAGRLMTAMQRQLALAEVQREAQIEMSGISDDIKNSLAILSISSDTLVLNSFNLALGFDPAVSNIFNPDSTGTVTYAYGRIGNNYGLIRTAQFKTWSNQRMILKNLLITPDITNYIFAPFPSTASPPYEAVDVALRMGNGFLSSSPRIYETQVMKRSHTT